MLCCLLFVFVFSCMSISNKNLISLWILFVCLCLLAVSTRTLHLSFSSLLIPGWLLMWPCSCFCRSQSLMDLLWLSLLVWSELLINWRIFPPPHYLETSWSWNDDTVIMVGAGLDRDYKLARLRLRGDCLMSGLRSGALERNDSFVVILDSSTTSVFVFQWNASLLVIGTET